MVFPKTQPLNFRIFTWYSQTPLPTTPKGEPVWHDFFSTLGIPWKIPREQQQSTPNHLSEPKHEHQLLNKQTQQKWQKNMHFLNQIDDLEKLNSLRLMNWGVTPSSECSPQTIIEIKNVKAYNSYMDIILGDVSWCSCEHGRSTSKFWFFVRK